MAIIKKELPLVFQYIQISSPIPFYIYGSDNEKAKRLLPSNAYVLRSAELLTSEKAPNQPIWKVYIEYDDSLLVEGQIVEINGFNVDFSKYLETFGGQLVRLGDDQFQALYTIIRNSNPITYYNGTVHDVDSFGFSFIVKGHISVTGTFTYYENNAPKTVNRSGDCYGEFIFINQNGSYYFIPKNDFSKYVEVLITTGTPHVEILEFRRVNVTNKLSLTIEGSIESIKQ